jgi:hypothetical protein
MSPLRHAVAWIAVVAGAASATVGLAHPADLASLEQRWLAQLVDGFGTARAVRLSAASRLDPASALPTLLALRACTLGAWSWLLVPLWLAAALQGWAIADIRRASFAAASPALHRMARHAAIAVAGAVLLALSLPLDVPVATIPAGGALVAVLVGGHFAHRPSWRG